MFFRTALVGCLLWAGSAMADPLPSWNDTETKSAIMAFVESVTDPASPDYVTPADRIATFDNDGNLWAEQPVYFQLIYALERVRERAEADPSILSTDALKAAAEGDVEALAAGGIEGLLEVLAISHSGISVEDFQADVLSWFDTARHPSTGMRYDAMIYQPMLELLSYLRDEGFQTWIVSGGGVHFVRAFAEEVYGIPPQQVVGSAGPTEYVDGKVMKLPGIDFVDDKEGKPLGIDNRIGKRPIFASGNSDGDFAMLEYVTSGEGPRFGLLLHHTDAEREFAYDREGHVGVLNRGLDEGPGRGWVIIDMAEDWNRVFPN
ncbi:HAD family hydrolase [Dinoroseobacter sp. S76]|uniref:HAD family hydrolase n=1 Tax=Dinoroseobacter sp. S76 TaxID=3415124 RepID=UPI003C7B39F6